MVWHLFTQGKDDEDLKSLTLVVFKIANPQQNQIVIDMLSLCCLPIPKRSADTQHPLLPFSLLNAFSKLNLHLWIVCQISFSYKKESCHYAVCEPMQCLVTDTFIQEMLNVQKPGHALCDLKKFFFAVLVIISKGFVSSVFFVHSFVLSFADSMC